MNARNRWQDALDLTPTDETWKGVDELLAQESAESSGREFPIGFATDPGFTRRDVLGLFGASAALAGLGACNSPPEGRILPYIHQPPEVIPSATSQYATGIVVNGAPSGLLVTMRDGRPLKIEGNPEHPETVGAAGVFEQAALLQLYDPQRSRRLRQRDTGRTFEAFATNFLDATEAGPLGVLLEEPASPLLQSILDRARPRQQGLRVYRHTAAPDQSPWQTRLQLRDAEVIVSVGEDFLASYRPARLAREFADRRRQLDAPSAMNRLYVAETDLTITGAMADHRVALRPTEWPLVTRALMAEIIALGVQIPGMPPELRSRFLSRGGTSALERWARLAARDLVSRRGRGVVLAGENATPAVHHAVRALNAALGSEGTLVRHYARGPADGDLNRLVADIQSKAITRLLILGGNPVYSAPPGLKLADRLRGLSSSAHWTLFANETSAICEWSVPAAHPLESWGDAQDVDGLVTLQQPLIAPLQGGTSSVEVLSRLAGRSPPSPRVLLEQRWAPRLAALGMTFEGALQRGFFVDDPPPTNAPDLSWGVIAGGMTEPRPLGANMFDLVLRPDYRVLNGEYTNVAWLLELPDPITKLTWGNAAHLSPRTAAGLGIETGRFIRLTRGDQKLTLPALVVPGHADGAVTVTLGYGRSGEEEELARGVGVNGYVLSGTSPETGTVKLEVLEDSGKLPITQTHSSLEGRPIALQKTLAEYRAHPHAETSHASLFTMYQPNLKDGPQWGMSIDMTVCTGCSACMVACQAENNVPVVGPRGVLRAREMHWLRIDRYFAGSPESPTVIMQPMLCQHCEKAPCEYVCPVNATTHSPDGLNEMTYNRCVGTRFCSNNCPYKVRRFNFFDYNADKAPTLRLAMNPEVTVRARGVMEKCTFCVQRIRNTEITERVTNKPLGSLPIQTACAQACPTKAIVFGNLADKNSEVSRLHEESRSYAVLDELGTQPRVRYLPRITNPNPSAEQG